MIVKIERQNKTTTFISSEEINYKIEEIANEDFKKLRRYSFFKDNPNVIIAMIYSESDYNYHYNICNTRKIDIPKGYFEPNEIRNFCPAEDNIDNFLIAYRNIENRDIWSFKKPSVGDLRGKNFPTDIEVLFAKSKSTISDSEVGTVYLLNDNGKTIEILH